MIINPFRFGGGGGGGAFPTFLNTATASTASTATNHPITLMATINASDLLVAFFSQNWGAGETVTPPTGWTGLATYNLSNIQVMVAYKVAAGTEGGTSVSFTTSLIKKSAIIVARIQAGTYSGVPECAGATATSSTAPDPPSLSPSWGSANNLCIAFAGYRAVITAPSAYPFASNQTFIASTSGSGLSNSAASAICTDNIASGTLNPGAFTIGASTTVAGVTVAIRPV